MRKYLGKTAAEYVDSAIFAFANGCPEILSGGFVLREANFGGVCVCDQTAKVLAVLEASGKTMEKMYTLTDMVFDYCHGDLKINDKVKSQR